MTNIEKKIYNVGIYCRLSKDDGTGEESVSIDTQRNLLTSYVRDRGWNVKKIYIDDGYSGTNFERPDFKNMINDIENGLIDCVITKDLSRLGRNYLDCGLYLEVFFPEHNVRYIAVNDGVDTLNRQGVDISPFKNILNEMYASDVSSKVSSAIRARFKQGKFMGTTPPYGYLKDPDDHNHLIVDEKVSYVVKMIFDLALEGNGIAKIMNIINTKHILRPAAYAVVRGDTGYDRYFEDDDDNRYRWSQNSVRGILRNPVYAGHLVGYKRPAISMKVKKRPSRLPEDWEVIPNTHEAIISQEVFDTVQKMVVSRRRQPTDTHFDNVFAGVLKCADCGYAMRMSSAHRRKRPELIDCIVYSCNNYGRYGNARCTSHQIEARDLFESVLNDINHFAKLALNDEKAVKKIEKQLSETDKSETKKLEREQKKIKKRLTELDKLFSSLYEDKVLENITQRNFEMMSSKYQEEQNGLEERLAEITETIEKALLQSQGVNDFVNLIKKYDGITELTSTIVHELIDKITVSEREKLPDGTVQQEIKIYYKFVGYVGDLHITPTERWACYPPKKCITCGEEFVPGSPIAQYCPACAAERKRIQCNESKRRQRAKARQEKLKLNEQFNPITYPAK